MLMTKRFMVIIMDILSTVDRFVENLRKLQ